MAGGDADAAAHALMDIATADCADVVPLAAGATEPDATAGQAEHRG